MFDDKNDYNFEDNNDNYTCSQRYVNYPEIIEEVTNTFSLTVCVAECALLCFRGWPNPLSAQLSAGSMEKP
jgi:hypothetical protein